MKQPGLIPNLTPNNNQPRPNALDQGLPTIIKFENELAKVRRGKRLNVSLRTPDFEGTVSGQEMLQTLPAKGSPELKKIVEAQKNFADTTDLDGLSRKEREQNLEAFLCTLLPYSKILVNSEDSSILEDAKTFSGEEIRRKIVDHLKTDSPSVNKFIFEIPDLPDFKDQLELLILKVLSTQKEKTELQQPFAPKNTPTDESLHNKFNVRKGGEAPAVWSSRGGKINREEYITPDQSGLPLPEDTLGSEMSTTPTADSTTNTQPSIYQQVPTPQGNSTPPKELMRSGFIRPAEETFAELENSLRARHIAGLITAEQYLAETKVLLETKRQVEKDQAEKYQRERKKIFRENNPSFVKRFTARLLGVFSHRKNNPTAIDQEKEQTAPTLDQVSRVSTQVIPALSGITTETKYPYKLAQNQQGITDVTARPVQDNKKGEAAGSKNPTNAIPQTLSLGYSMKEAQNLSKEQLDALLKTNTSGLSQKQIDDIVSNYVLKNNIRNLKTKKQSPLKSLTQEELQTNDPLGDLFDDGLNEELEKREQARNRSLQERLSNWKGRLGSVATTTKNKLESTLEKVGPHGKKLVSLLTRGSEYLNTQVNNKAVRLFAAAGLVSAGAMAAYATPIVLASMAGVGLGMRIISAAGMYKLVRKQLDDKYKEWEKDGKKKNTLSIAGMEAGAVGIALFSGEMIGKAFELIASSDIVHEVATSIKNTANIESVKESWSKLLFGSDAPVSTLPTEEALASSASSPVIPTETTTTGVEAKTTTPLENAVAPTNADLQHVVKKGDNLWSLLRGDLSRLNFEGFNELTQKGQEKMIQEFVNKIDVPSGSKDLIRIGEKLDFNKYFRR